MDRRHFVSLRFYRWYYRKKIYNVTFFVTYVSIIKKTLNTRHCSFTSTMIIVATSVFFFVFISHLSRIREDRVHLWQIVVPSRGN